MPRSFVLRCRTYRSTRVGTRNRPAGLGDPNPLAGRDPVDCVASVFDRFPEDVGSIADGSVLEVRISGMEVSTKSLDGILNIN